MWTSAQVKQHIEAARRLGLVKDAVARYIGTHPRTSELEVQGVVLNLFRRHGLKMDAHAPIVAFQKHTSNVHYFVDKRKNARLRKDTLILLDIWARLNKSRAPYADMTWMFYYGDDVPQKFDRLFGYVLSARNRVITSIRRSIKRGDYPAGAYLDLIARDYLRQKDVGLYFSHHLGHALGTRSPHGTYGGLQRNTKTTILKQLGYTIEPGIYFKNKYGFRSEIDFYINRSNEMIITTPLQRQIELISSRNT